MNKIWLVIKREYITRVRNKMFLVSTFLLPVVLVLFIAGATYLSIKGKDTQKIAVNDPNNYFRNSLKSSDDVKFEFPAGVDTLNYIAKGYNGIVMIPSWDGKQELRYDLRSPRQLGSDAARTVDKNIRNAIQDKVLEQKGFTAATLDSLRDASPKSHLNEISGNSGQSKKTSSAFPGVSVLAVACLFIL